MLETLPLLENSDDFVFDNQMLAQILVAGFEIGEVCCPAAYFAEASSINFRALGALRPRRALDVAAGVRAAQAARAVRDLRPEAAGASIPSAPPSGAALASVARAGAG